MSTKEKSRRGGSAAETATGEAGGGEGRPHETQARPPGREI